MTIISGQSLCTLLGSVAIGFSARSAPEDKYVRSKICEHVWLRHGHVTPIYPFFEVRLIHPADRADDDGNERGIGGDLQQPRAALSSASALRHAPI